MGQVLYRKYRSKRFGEIVGQEHITTTLEHALKQGTISHAYLFTGPRGVGKTSIARILAHEINGLPYTDESTHLDIIEIDAASNRRIDEIRDLRDKVHLAPTSAKYKVYIIDEVHMLTREAFNALLKTLEEPPEHVVFILATTEAHKLPATIISRTQRFTFKPVPAEQVIAHLKSIAKSEKVTIDDEALQLLADYGEGSFRDSISLLDQVRNQSGDITAENVRSLLGLAPKEAVSELAQTVSARDALNIVKLLKQLQSQGIEAATIAIQLGGFLRQQLLDNTIGLPADETLNLLKELVEVPAATNPSVTLEISLLKIALKGSAPPAPEPATEPSPKPKQHTERPKVEAPPPIQTKHVKKTASTDSDWWPQLLDTVKRQHNTLYSVLRMAKPHFDGSDLELGVTFAFHQKRLNEARNQKIIADTAKELTGQNFNVTCVVVEKDTYLVESPAPKAVEKDGALGAISTIFGGAELLEQ